MNVPPIREFRLSSAGRGVSCDANGAFVGAVPLLKRSLKSGREIWEPRENGELSAAIGSDFGLPVDMSSKAAGLLAIARALNEGNIARAQIATVLLAIPDIPALSKDMRSREDSIKFIRELYRSDLIKWDEDEHPRRPAGAPDSQGGQFAPKGEGDGALDQSGDSVVGDDASNAFLRYGAQEGKLDDGVYHPDSDPAQLDPASAGQRRSLPLPWLFGRPKSPDVAPEAIDLSQLDSTFQSLMSQSFAGGHLREHGGTLFADSQGNISIGNLGGVSSDSGNFYPNLTTVPFGLTAVGFFHTHPYNDGTSLPFSGQDVAQQIDYKMDVSIVQSDGGNQWLMLRTQQTPDGQIDSHAAENWMEEEAPRRLPAPVYENRQFAALTIMARQYGLAFYIGRNGVFTRVYPPSH